MTETGANFSGLERFGKAIMALAISNYVMTIIMKNMRFPQPLICKECYKKGQIATADFGGKFRCKICNKLITMVPSVGHGVACPKCQKEGYCQYCGKRLIEII